MRKKQTIRKFSSALLLLIFSIGVTPKTFLHSVFANHKDTIATLSAGDADHQLLKTASIHCQVDDLVVQSPFVPGLPVPVEISVPVFVHSYISFVNSFISSKALSFGLRGPPALA